MKPIPAIVEPSDADLALGIKSIKAALGAMIVAEAAADHDEKIIERHTTSARGHREEARRQRLEIGTWLAKLRRRWPERGPKAKGWGELLRRVGVSEDSALRWMAEAKGFPAATNVRETPDPADSDVRPTSPPLLSLVPDQPAPQLTQDQLFEQLARLDPEAQQRARKVLRAASAKEDGDRDSYCTPEPITRCFPVVDFDPCSNSRSTVRARRACWFVERGEDGLAIEWVGAGYWNVPYSKPLPWAEKFDRERPQITAAAWLVNTDQSTEWWSLLIRHLPIRLDFDERIQFTPPPGVKPSQNDRPQTLLMDAAFWSGCDRAGLLKLGKLWRRDDNP